VTHRANARFWRCYRALPAEVRDLADRSYALLKTNPKHGSLHFKQVGALWSVRVGRHYRGLATSIGDDVVWFWIGSHADYDKLVGRKPVNKPLLPPSRAKRTAKKTPRSRTPRG